MWETRGPSVPALIRRWPRASDGLGELLPSLRLPPMEQHRACGSHPSVHSMSTVKQKRFHLAWPGAGPHFTSRRPEIPARISLVTVFTTPDDDRISLASIYKSLLLSFHGFDHEFSVKYEISRPA